MSRSERQAEAAARRAAERAEQSRVERERLERLAKIGVHVLVPARRDGAT